MRDPSHGRCCAEYAVALANGRIANSTDPAVIEVYRSRKWPTTVREYAAMMYSHNKDDPPVEFTKSGDRDLVTFNFHKMITTLHLKRRQASRMRDQATMLASAAAEQSSSVSNLMKAARGRVSLRATPRPKYGAAEAATAATAVSEC